MTDPGDELMERVRQILTEAGFQETSTSGEGIRLIRHARGVLVGWLPEELTHTAYDDRLPRAPGTGAGELAALRHVFPLALAVTLRAAGFAVETRDEEWLLILDTPTPHPTS
ncbi:hypothetical protein ACGFXC_36420 [Streptomyces sp. NPDC048507]|uniref:hypothetical protein n=1 Tax=Streptomyces sp. NPDC048507 TaxID=3365560 RepID=UPI00372340FC